MTSRYVVYGNKSCINEALDNALITRKYIGHYSLCLVTDKDSILSNDLGLFDVVIEHPSPSFTYRDKISCLLLGPFGDILFLDADAKLIHTPEYLFALLDAFDFAACHAPVRHPPGWSDLEVPQTFPELNSGVLLLSAEATTLPLLSDWLTLYDRLNSKFGQNWDQASLRSIIWKYLKSKSLRQYVLPPEANLRTSKPWIAGRGQPVYVVHGRFNANETQALIDFLNTNIDRQWSCFEWIDLNPDTTIRPRFDKTYC